MSKGKFLEDNKISKFVEEKILPRAIKVGEQKHLKAIRDGMVSSLPLTVVGGLSLILASPPVDPEVIKGGNIFSRFLLFWYNWAQANGDSIILPFKMTMAIMALFVCMGIAYSLSNYYKEENLNPFNNAIIAGVLFLLIAAPAQDDMIPMEFLDAKGIFTAIFISIVSVEITRKLVDKELYIKMPKSVPSAVSGPFVSLVPMIVNIMFFYSINLLIIKFSGVNFPQLISKLLTPAFEGANTLGFMLVIMLINQLLWFIGIHGDSLVGVILMPILTTNLVANATAVAAGNTIPYLWTDAIRGYCMKLGGAGSTLALAILFLFSKSKQLKSVGKVSIVPGLFNINEPLLFGGPVILNPILGIPFIITPLINGIIVYTLITIKFMGKSYLEVPWTTPAIIGYPLTAMDWRGIFVILLLLLVDMIIYYPFFKSYEKTLIQQEDALD